MRGNRSRGAVRRGCEGTIPAHAGEPARRRGSTQEPRDYPRACGGTLRILGQRPQGEGLSPRMRGNRVTGVFRQGIGGTIPAHAGEPVPLFFMWLRIRDYPRACGGTPGHSGHTGHPKGLSPRMRGNLIGVGSLLGLQGTIPAHAGEPNKPFMTSRRNRDYPRACGGTNIPPGVLPPLSGLSPRMRGNQLRRSRRTC